MAEPKPFTPYLWLRRGRVFYIVHPGPAPEYRKLNTTTGFRANQEAKAKKALALYIEGRKRIDVLEGAGADGPLTVARLMEQWLANRTKKGISTVDDYRGRMQHALPIIGHLRADAVRLEDIERVMDAIKPDENKPTPDDLAPRTQRRVFEALKAMFNWAVPKLLDKNPCAGIKADDLPANVDADREWRGKAFFPRAEVVQLLTDERVPLDRRVFYAISFLAGPRFGEVSALRWRHYEPATEPLGMLTIADSYHSKKKRVKSTKANRTRSVPVHPELATILDQWRMVGWPALMGRAPTADDLIVPAWHGGHRNASTMWRQLNGERDREGRRKQMGDLERLGLRRRRQHDTRRTFTSLMRGGDKGMLRLITHGLEGDMQGLYTEVTLVWEPLCREVLKLRIDLRKGAESQGQGDDKVATEVAMGEIGSDINRLDSDPSGIRTRHGGSDGRSQTETVDVKRRVSAGSAPARHAAFAANPGRSGSMATLATLALRQALAALDRGRIDQAREVIQRAIEQEVDEQEVAS